MDKEASLIEYAIFSGVIQIVRYLKYSNVQLKPSMWFYVVRSNNAELVHFLEENEIKPEKKYRKRIESTTWSLSKSIYNFTSMNI